MFSDRYDKKDQKYFYATTQTTTKKKMESVCLLAVCSIIIIKENCNRTEKKYHGKAYRIANAVRSKSMSNAKSKSMSEIDTFTNVG